jgi:hypothetical protein
LIDIKPEYKLSIGDTDISGSIELTEKFNVYVSGSIWIENERKFIV